MDTLLLSGLLVVVTTVLVAKLTSVFYRERDRITRVFEDLHRRIDDVNTDLKAHEERMSRLMELKEEQVHRRIDGVEMGIERREETMYRHIDQVHQDLLKENGSLVRSLKK